MGFFYQEDRNRKPQRNKGYPPEFLHKHECNACPLNNQPGLRHPHMDPYGSERPLIYCLGESPGENEDKKGIPFVGKAGKTLHLRIPEDMESLIRWNNCVRTRPPGNRTPEYTELECCRPSIVRDIEKTKPKAIFGFGNVPLQWALQENRITNWSGRRVPIRIGSHTCWYYPMMHPSYVMRTRGKFEPRTPNEYGSEIEFAFSCNLRDAFDEVMHQLPPPVVHTLNDVFEGVDHVTGAHGKSDLDTVTEFLRYAAKETIVGFDYETKGIRPFSKGARILTVALGCKNGTLAFPLYHPQAKWSKAELEHVQHAFTEFLHTAKCRKVVHQLSFEQEWSAHFYGPACLHATKWGDSITQAYTLDERRGAHNLDFLCLQYFGFHLKAISNLDRNRLDESDLEAVLRYNALDAKYHRLLYIQQDQRIRDEGLLPVYKHLVRRVPTMVLTQIKGVPVDQDVVRKFHKQYVRQLKKIEDKIAALPVAAQFKSLKRTAYRPSAPHDIRFVLVKILRKVLEGGVSENELESMKSIPIVKLTLEWRKVNKNLSTYVKPLMPGSPHLYPDGLLHPHIKTTDTRTSRTSSDDPNIQNFPKHKTKEVRSQVKHPGGHKIVAFDYAGIQARNVAMESKDKALVKAFWNRYDVHSEWRDRIARHYPKWLVEGPKALQDKDLAKAYRQIAKNFFVFPSFFGAQPKTLSGYLKIPEVKIQRIVDEFWSEFPDIHKWQKRIQDDYKKTGYVTGLSGVRRRAPISPNELINAPIQADEALIVCDAMARLSELGEDRFQANLMVHDDLTFVWDKKDIDRNAEVVISEMLRIEYDWVCVPLEVEMSVGDDWASLKEVGKFESTGRSGWKELK